MDMPADHAVRPALRAASPHCNRCPVATALQPLGCYDRTRFDSQDAMEAQILWWSGGPNVEG